MKSCAGHEVQEAKLGKRGLEMDRLWMVVDRSGRFMSQRRYSKMALVTPSLPKSFNEVKCVLLIISCSDGGMLLAFGSRGAGGYLLVRRRQQNDMSFYHPSRSRQRK